MFLLIVTLIHFGAWNHDPTVAWEKQVDNLTQESCEKTADEYRKQYREMSSTTLLVVCVKR
jgi:hypothetical protein